MTLKWFLYFHKIEEDYTSKQQMLKHGLSDSVTAIYLFIYGHVKKPTSLWTLQHSTGGD